MRYLIIFILFSASSYALDTGDRMLSKIIKASNKNIIVLNRGMEDAVMKGDHMMLTNTNGFIARGICLKTSMKASHWKIYRVVRPKLVSFDDIYWLNGINQSEIPEDLLHYKEVDIGQYLKYDDNDADKALRLQQKRIAEYDLPKNLTADDFYTEREDKRWKHFVEKNFDKNKFKKDNALYKGTLRISPVSSDSFASSQVNNFAVNIDSVGDKYLTSMTYRQQDMKYKDPLSDEEFSWKKKEADLNFTVKKVWKYLDSVHSIRYRQQRMGESLTPESHTQVGIMGWRYWMNRTSENQYSQISYIPTIDSRLDRFSSDKYEDKFQSDSGYRHHVEFEFRLPVTNNIYVHNKLVWQPLMDTTSYTNDYSNAYTWNDLTLGYRFNKHFELAYQYNYTKDPVLKDFRDLPEYQTRYSFQLKFNFIL